MQRQVPETEPTITTTLMPAGRTKRGYSFTLVADGGSPPYTWSIVSGSLPHGLNLERVTGVTSGRPTKSGESSFTVQVTDASSHAATRLLTIEVNAYSTKLIAIGVLVFPFFAGWLATVYLKFAAAAHALLPHPGVLELLDLPNWTVVMFTGGFVLLCGTVSAVLLLRDIPKLVSTMKQTQVEVHTDSAHFIKQLQTGLTDMSVELQDVRHSGSDAVRAATGLIDNTLGTSFGNLHLLNSHPDEYNQALEALGFNFRNWFDPINNNKDLPEMVSAWLRYTRTYYLEEAFDIKRREIVTNARNFTYLLLNTLDVLASFCSKSTEKGHPLKALHFAVTPVHPKDWYNWPHGRATPRAYYEEDFLAHFWRCLREALRAKGLHDVLEVSRIVLAASDEPARTESSTRFGWPLDRCSQLQQDLKYSWLLPVSLPLRSLGERNEEAASAIFRYYSSLVRNAGYEAHSLSVVPLVCERWASDAKSQDVGDMLIGLNKIMKQRPDEVLGLVALAASVHREELEKYKKNLDAALSQVSGHAIEIWKTCRAACDALVGGDTSHVFNFLKLTQIMDVHLSTYEAPRAFQAQELLRRMVMAALRFKDTLEAEKLKALPCLGKVFSESFQSSPHECTVVALNTNAILKWSELGLRNEFHMFGIKDAGGTETWRILIAAEIDYPFEVTKVHIIEPGWQKREQGGRQLAGFSEYARVIANLRQSSPSVDGVPVVRNQLSGAS